MTSSLLSQIAVPVLSGIILFILKEAFEKYKRTNDFTKLIFSFAVCAILGVLLAVIGYALLEKFFALSIILFIVSALYVFVEVYMFFAAAKCMDVSTKAINQMTESISERHADGHDDNP